MAKQERRYRRKIKGDGLIEQWPADLPAPQVVANSCWYVGSEEHKKYPLADGFDDVLPHPRFGASMCPPSVTKDMAEEALREAVRRECVSAAFTGMYPRWVWAWVAGQPFAARLTNRTRGEYKGWPVDLEELPTCRDGRLDGENWEHDA